MRIFAILMILVAGTVANGETIVADLSQRAVSIDTNFTGSEILIFGAVRRAIDPDDTDVDVIVTVAGPETPLTVRRKSQVAGIWVNTDEAQIDSAPSFYTVLTTAPLAQVLSETEDLRHHITKQKVVRAVDVGAKGDPIAFTDAMLRIKEASGVYSTHEGAVTLEQGTLFRTTAKLPANLVEGDYTTRIFLTRRGQVLTQYETQIAVRKVGLGRFLYRLAHDLPFLYGLMSLAIAIFAGWAASAAFNALRPR